MTAVAAEPTSATAATQPSDAPAPADTTPDDMVLADVLVEEISIDGMCGVY
jgi:mycofactocin precursor